MLAIRATIASTALIALAGAGACAGRSVDPLAGLPAAADAAEYTPYLEPGPAMITGQAFLTTRGGDVIRGAGREVTLDPATTYAKQWLAGAGGYVDYWAFVPPDSLFRRARRIATADADGKFRFTNVPPGSYILRSTVTWEIPSSAYTTSRQGGVVYALVDVPAGDSVQVMLNQLARY